MQLKQVQFRADVPKLSPMTQTHTITHTCTLSQSHRHSHTHLLTFHQPLGRSISILLLGRVHLPTLNPREGRARWGTHGPRRVKEAGEKPCLVTK